jgi:ATP synthase protein I
MRTQLRGAAIARAVCLTQVVILALAVALTSGIWGRPPALAALYGGLVAIIPTGWFAFRVFGRPAQDPRQALGSFYQGEIGKFTLTALLFGLGAVWFAKQFLALMVTYAACQLAYWLVIARMGFDFKTRP